MSCAKFPSLQLIKIYLRATQHFHKLSLPWHHNGRDDVSNHQPHHYYLNSLFRRRSKKTSKFCVTGLCAGNPPVTGDFVHKWPVTREMFPLNDVIMELCSIVSEMGRGFVLRLIVNMKDRQEHPILFRACFTISMAKIKGNEWIVYFDFLHKYESTY